MKLQIKRSNQLDSGIAKEPSSDQMEYGELALNYNSSDVSLFVKDDSNNIVKLYGDPKISLGETEPTNPVSGDLWWNSTSTDGSLYIYYTYLGKIDHQGQVRVAGLPDQRAKLKRKLRT